MSDLAAPAPAPTHSPLREALTGPVASIAVTFLAVLALGLAWVGPQFVSFSNVSIIGSFLVVPMIVGACSGFALLSGVVDLSVGSMVGLPGIGPPVPGWANDIAVVAKASTSTGKSLLSRNDFILMR